MAHTDKLVRFIVPLTPPDVRVGFTAEENELRVTNAIRDVHIAVADLSIAVQFAASAEYCLALHQRIDGLLLAIGAVADAALIKADDLLTGPSI